MAVPNRVLIMMMPGTNHCSDSVMGIPLVPTFTGSSLRRMRGFTVLELRVLELNGQHVTTLTRENQNG